MFKKIKLFYVLFLLTIGSVLCYSLSPPQISLGEWTANDDFHWGDSIPVPTLQPLADNVVAIPSTVGGLVISCNASYPIEWIFSHEQLRPYGGHGPRRRLLTTVSTTRKSSDIKDIKSFVFIADLRFIGSSTSITGNYTCRKINSKNLSNFIYVYWEGSSPPFLVQAGQNRTVYPDKNNAIILPCTISVPDTSIVPMELYKMENNTWKKVENPEYDPTIGFTLSNPENTFEPASYRCVANGEFDKDFALMHTEKQNKTQNVFPNIRRFHANFGYDKDTKQFICCSNGASPPKMMHFYCEHPITCKLRTNSLWDIENTGTKYNATCSSVRIFSQLAGIFRCKGDGIDIVREYFFPSGFQFGFRRIKPVPEDPYYRWGAVNQSRMLAVKTRSNNLYVGQNIIASCQASTYYFSRGIRWVLNWKNMTDTTIEEQIMNETVSNHKHGIWQFFRRNINSIQLPADKELKSITCYAPIWNTTEWVQKVLPLNVNVPVTPKVIGDENKEIIEWYFNDTNKVLNCQMGGDPMPIITWTKDNNTVKYPYKGANGTSVVTISRVTYDAHGEYVCIGENFGGRAEKIIQVIVYEKGSSSTGIAVGIVISLIILSISLIGIALLVRRIRAQRNIIDHLAVQAFKEVQNISENGTNGPPPPMTQTSLSSDYGREFNQDSSVHFNGRAGADNNDGSSEGQGNHYRKF